MVWYSLEWYAKTWPAFPLPTAPLLGGQDLCQMHVCCAAGAFLASTEELLSVSKLRMCGPPSSLHYMLVLCDAVG